MAIISTSALHKITTAVLLVAFVTFGVAEIHKRLLAPSPQPEQAQTSSTEFASGGPTPAVSDPLGLVESIVGTFQGWEEIDGSEDRYILLTNSKTGQAFPKIRVGFEFTTFYVVKGSEDIAGFAVEKDKEDDLLFAFNFFTYREIDELIKKEDSTKIYLKRKLEKEENLKDELGNLLAQGLVIKGERNKIEQVIGRKIPKP